MSEIKEIKLRYNKSLTYIMPMLMNEITDLRNNLIGVFIGDADYPELNNHIFLQYKFNGSISFLDSEEKLKKNQYFEISYDPDKYTVMYVFKVPEKWQKDYNRFLKSQYSRFSIEYKTLIISTHNLNENSIIYQILFRKEEAYLKLEEELNCKIPRELEASGILNPNKEIFNKNKIN